MPTSDHRDRFVHHYRTLYNISETNALFLSSINWQYHVGKTLSCEDCTLWFFNYCNVYNTKESMNNALFGVVNITIVSKECTLHMTKLYPHEYIRKKSMIGKFMSIRLHATSRAISSHRLIR